MKNFKLNNMNTQHKKFLLSIITIFIVMLLPMLASAQLDGTPNPPENAPIDGGLSLLIAAGVGYGAKKLRKKKVNCEYAPDIKSVS